MLPPRAAAVPVAPLLLLTLALAAGAARAADDLASDAAALQAFLAPFGSATVTWDASRPACSWTGVVCTGGRVTEIHLPGDGLRGALPVGALGGLTKLAVLSLRYNALSGPLPPDIAARPSRAASGPAVARDRAPAPPSSFPPRSRPPPRP